MLSDAYFLGKFRFDTAENEPAKNLQKFAKFCKIFTWRGAPALPRRRSRRENRALRWRAAEPRLRRWPAGPRGLDAAGPGAEFQPRPALLPFPRQRRATLHRVHRSDDFGAVRYVNRMIFSFSCPENSDFRGQIGNFSWNCRGIRHCLEQSFVIFKKAHL